MKNQTVDNNDAEADRKSDRQLGTLCVVGGLNIVPSAIKVARIYNEQSKVCEVQPQNCNEYEESVFHVTLANPHASLLGSSLLLLMAGLALRKRTEPQSAKPS